MFGLYLVLAAALSAQDPAPATAAPAPPAPPAAAPLTNEQRFPIPSPLPNGPALAGDDARDCASLYAESKYRVAQSNQLNQQALNKTYQKSAETKALETMSQVGGMIPILGDIIAMGSAMGQMATTKADAERNYGELNRKSDWALDRMVYVSDLYRKRCIKGAK